MTTDPNAWSDDDYGRYLESLGQRNASIATKALFTRSRSGNPGSYFSGLGAIIDGTDFFLDPDSGLTERTPGDRWQRWGKKAHVAISEVVELARAAPIGSFSSTTTPSRAQRLQTRRRSVATSRVNAFQSAALAAMAWYWEREERRTRWSSSPLPRLQIAYRGSDGRTRPLG